jgi:serine-type D-Ala-D-Ala carboxypeptidase (penicillin-binding protein 5/6)
MTIHDPIKKVRQNISIFVMILLIVSIARVAFNEENGVEHVTEEKVRDTSVNAAQAEPQAMVFFLAQKSEEEPRKELPLTPITQPKEEIKEKLREEGGGEESKPIASTDSVIKSAAVRGGTLDGKDPLVSLAEDRRWPIASITKLMTAVILREQFELSTNITLGPKAISTEGIAGDFEEGEIFRANDLLKAMLVVSSNDAATALQGRFGDKLVTLMQNKAWQLGMSETTFADVTGLSFLNQSTTRDLARLAEYVYKSHPDLFGLTRSTEIGITEVGSGKERTLHNNNKFAGKPGFIGGKTGFIDQSGENLLSIFQSGGEQYLVIVLGSENRYKQTQEVYDYLTSR